jgi:hypothetical protein
MSYCLYPKKKKKKIIKKEEEEEEEEEESESKEYASFIIQARSKQKRNPKKLFSWKRLKSFICIIIN